MKKLTVIYGS